MRRLLTLEKVWTAAPEEELLKKFAPCALDPLPGPVQRFLKHAIAPGTALASAVRLQMHGEIKLKRWFSFSAEEVIHWNKAMIWKAAIRMHGIPVLGSDYFLNGKGGMQWKLFGLLPFLNVSSPDVTRSAADRVNIESLWLPSVLCREEVKWTATDQNHIHARFFAHNEVAQIDYQIDATGRLKNVSMPRWGNPDQEGFEALPFGAIVEEERSFGGYVLPSVVRVGWFIGTDRFEREGEFFRATIDQATFC
ncbi:MAG: hypothetical protein HIU93_11340 [Acidobacteria bacterium]|nr:hypothetical protein [Acidobacteriota bacterium]MBW4045828.1 hypothetical protein [Acidobacteriota bacterium]